MIEISNTIKLQPIQMKHISDIYNAISSNRVHLRKWLPFVDLTKDISVTQSFVEASLAERAIQYCIYEKDSLIGLIGFNNLDKTNRKTEIGYWLIEKAQGKGIITQSVKELLLLAFSDLELNKIVIKAAIENQKSRNIPEKLGFTLEGIERDGELLSDNQFTDLAIYGLLKREFRF